MKKYIKPNCILIEMNEPVCGHYDASGKWQWWGQQFTNEYFKEDSPNFTVPNVMSDSISNDDFLKYNNNVWKNEW